MSARHLLTVAILCAASAAGAQPKAGTHWSLSAGRSVLYGSAQPWISGDNDFMLSSTDTMVQSSGMRNVGHVALGGSRTLSGSALLLRAEVLYNANRGDPASSPSPTYLRQSLREETMLLGGGLEWDAMPSRSWSPYVLTTAGYRHTWIGWSRDPASDRVDRTVTTSGPFVSVGSGLRLGVGGREYFAEWRWYGIGHTVAGARFVPVSVGVRF